MRKIMNDNKEIVEYRNEILEKIRNNEDLSDLVFSINDMEIGILELSVYLGDKETVKILLESGINPNGKKGLDDISPLLIAAELKDTDSVNLLIKYRADVNQSDDLGITPLMVATKNNDIETIKSLVIAGANIYKSDFYGQSAISVAGAGDNHETFDFYTKVMIKNDDFKEYYDNPLFSAIASKNMVFIKKFAEVYDIKNIQNNYGKTPLHIAVENDYIEAIPYLLSKGVSINKADKEGLLIYNLSYQCQHLSERRQKIVNKLIEKHVPLKDRVEAIKSTIPLSPSSKRKLH